jgi:UDP-3-O-[3-hydroxymyristoyl] glucosamine N-acyltransferase
MYTVEFIAREIGGIVKGNSNQKVESVSPLEDVRKNSVVFIKEQKKFAMLDKTLLPLCVVLDFEPEEESKFDYIIIDTKEKDRAFIRLLSLFDKSKFSPDGASKFASISPKAGIGENVSLGDHVSVGEHTVIGDETSIESNVVIGHDCRIGRGCTIYPNVTVYPNTVMEDNVIIHGGAVIGSDGFGYSKLNGVITKIPQLGGVYLEKNVEIGANTTIDRATLGYTRIGENTKIDNLVQIAHNCEIGQNTIICASCGIAGSVKIGSNVIIAGACGIADHIVIEDDVILGPMAGLTKKRVKKGSYLWGAPAFDYRECMEYFAMRPKIKEMYKDLKKIKEKFDL